MQDVALELYQVKTDLDFAFKSQVSQISHHQVYSSAC